MLTPVHSGMLGVQSSFPARNCSATLGTQPVGLRTSVLTVLGLLKMRPALNAKLTRLHPRLLNNPQRDLNHSYVSAHAKVTVLF